MSACTSAAGQFAEYERACSTAPNPARCLGVQAEHWAASDPDVSGPPVDEFQAACSDAPDQQQCVGYRVSAWTVEEQRRIAQAEEARRRIGRALVAMSSANAGYVAPRSSYGPSASSQPAGTLVSNYVSGMNRVCAYNTVSGITTAVVSAASICPILPPANAGRPSGRSASGFLDRQYAQGMNRVCIYNTVRGEEAITISATSICPISLPN